MPKGKKAIPSTRKLLWNKYIGDHLGIGTCSCCSNQIKEDSYIIAYYKDTDGYTLNNLRAVCHLCHQEMKDMQMDIKSYNEFYEFND